MKIHKSTLSFTQSSNFGRNSNLTSRTSQIGGSAYGRVSPKSSGKIQSSGWSTNRKKSNHLVNHHSQVEPNRNLSRMSTTSRTSRMSRRSSILPTQPESFSKISQRSSVTARKDITLVAREFPPVTKFGF